MLLLYCSVEGVRGGCFLQRCSDEKNVINEKLSSSIFRDCARLLLYNLVWSINLINEQFSIKCRKKVISSSSINDPPPQSYGWAILISWTSVGIALLWRNSDAALHTVTLTLVVRQLLRLMVETTDKTCLNFKTQLHIQDAWNES